MIGTCCAYATPVEEVEAEQDVVMQNIYAQQQQLDKLSNEYNDALIRQEEITSQKDEVEKSIQEVEEKLKKNEEQLKKQSVQKYKQKEISLIDIVTDSKDFYDLLVNLDFYNRTIAQFNKTIQTNKELKDTLSVQKQELEVRKKELDEEFIRIENAKQEADKCIQELQEQYSKLDEEKAKILIEQQTAQTSKDNSDAAAANDNSPVDLLVNGTVAAELANDTDFINYISSLDAESQAAVVSDAQATVAAGGNLGDVVSRAYSMIGSPYSWGGTTSSGFDCSGFVSYCLTGQEGTRLGTTGTFARWTQVSDPQPGDVCVVHNDYSQHTGIYVGDGKMVHAATYGVGVVEGNVQSGMIYVRYSG